MRTLLLSSEYQNKRSAGLSFSLSAFHSICSEIHFLKIFLEIFNFFRKYLRRWILRGLLLLPRLSLVFYAVCVAICQTLLSFTQPQLHLIQGGGGSASFLVLAGIPLSIEQGEGGIHFCSNVRNFIRFFTFVQMFVTLYDSSLSFKCS